MITKLCPTCMGIGYVSIPGEDTTAPDRCQTCQGSGWVTVINPDPIEQYCPYCGQRINPYKKMLEDNTCR